MVQKSFYSLQCRFILLFSLLFCSSATAISTYDLRCALLSNPLGIDNTKPALSWKISLSSNGIRQSAYQILAASSPELLNEQKADLWNTGKVNSDHSQWIQYAGKSLQSRSIVYWKVKIWDGENKISNWSSIAKFTVGILTASEWKAKYIGVQHQDTTSQPLLRKKFSVQDNNRPAFLHINTLGYHEVYLNGQEVSDDVLVPAVSEFTKRSLAMTYDVSTLLQQGENNIVIWLGKGWYDATCQGPSAGGPYVMAEIDRLNGDKWETIVATDKSWQSKASGYYSPGQWGKVDFQGENVDASQLLPDFSVQTLDSVTWQGVYEPILPQKLITPMMCEPNKIHEEIQPVSIRRFDSNTWMVDMGKSVVGWTDVNFGKLLKGQKIRLSYCDMLALNGDFEYGVFNDNYTACGNGNEHFCNKFNYHAYRYIKIQGLNHKPKLNDITAYLIYTGYETNSSFICSDKDMNDIHNMIHYTFPCLTQSGEMVDCPHLERKGYGGDGNASIVSAQTMYNLYPLYSNWIQAYADAQGDDGEVSHIGPNPSPCGGGPFWCAFIANAPWQTYINYGDKSILEHYYPNMQHYLSYAEQFMPDGLLTLEHRWPNTSRKNWFLGDWALPNEEHQLERTSVDDVNSCSMSWVYGTMSKIAKTLGKSDDQKLYENKQEAINKKIHETYFNANNNTYATGLQLDLAFPLFVNATPQDLKAKVQQALKDLTVKNFNGQFFTGLVGIPILTQWLTKIGEAQFVYDILKKRSYPGYLYMIDNNATTTWEHWEATRSRIHNCYNGIGSWFYQALGGILPDEANPGYKHFFLKPQPVDGISYVRTTKPTPYGNITVEWNKTDMTFDLKVIVPAGTTATLSVPFKAVSVEIPSTKKIRIGIIYSEKQAGMPDKPEIKQLKPNHPVELESGNYRIIYHLK